jgi:diketogulonate reductase-like aldo/keto reductase
MQGRCSRRDALQLMTHLGMGALLSSFSTTAENAISCNEDAIRTRPIPSSGEQLPVIGLGTWIQFDAGPADNEREPLRQVLRNMAARSGKVIDSSPMYGQSETVIGDLSQETKLSDKFFYATKVWTSGEENGKKQMEASMRKMRRTAMDLIQVHNLVDYQTHLKTLRKWKEEGKVRYIGITHYVDSSHEQLEGIIKAERPDFVQFNYSIRGRHAEQRLLPAAKDLGVAVIINQPFESGSLFNAVAGKKLPGWAADLQVNNWAQFFLKFIISHPAVTCAIPGTSDPQHELENIGAAYGPVPDENTRKKMAAYFSASA